MSDNIYKLSNKDDLVNRIKNDRYLSKFDL